MVFVLRESESSQNDQGLIQCSTTECKVGTGGEADEKIPPRPRAFAQQGGDWKCNTNVHAIIKSVPLSSSVQHSYTPFK